MRPRAALKITSPARAAASTPRRRGGSAKVRPTSIEAAYHPPRFHPNEATHKRHRVPVAAAPVGREYARAEAA